MTAPRTVQLDHFVLVAQDVETTVAFYRRVLGAEVRDLERWRAGAVEYPVLHFGDWKVNVHPVETPAAPRAARPTVGAGDFCVRWPAPLQDAVDHLARHGVPVELGPTPQEGARGDGASVYFRDPDGSLVELISYS